VLSALARGTFDLVEGVPDSFTFKQLVDSFPDDASRIQVANFLFYIVDICPAKEKHFTDSAVAGIRQPYDQLLRKLLDAKGELIDSAHAPWGAIDHPVSSLQAWGNIIETLKNKNDTNKLAEVAEVIDEVLSKRGISLASYSSAMEWPLFTRLFYRLDTSRQNELQTAWPSNSTVLFFPVFRHRAAHALVPGWSALPDPSSRDVSIFQELAVRLRGRLRAFQLDIARVEKGKKARGKGKARKASEEAKQSIGKD
jgi:hypothetical protein